MTGPLVLPEDIQIVPVAGFPAAVRAQIGGASDDYAVTRPRSRVPSKVIDAQAAALLREFVQPTTLVDAILRFSKTVQREPLEVLEDAYPFLESCLVAKLLVFPGMAAEPIEPALAVGDSVAGYRVEACVQVLADTELYRISADGQEAALKIARPDAEAATRELLQREARILERLQGRVGPQLLGHGATEDGRAYIATAWISGELCGEAAAALRTGSQEPLPQALLSLCVKVLEAYATLHGLGVVHTDVHQRNALVDKDGELRIIDYGLALVEDDPELAIAPRAGVAFFLDPECAAAALSNSAPPRSTPASEQYAVAALVYHLLSGRHYLDFSYEKEAMERQILEEPPVTLSARGLPGCARLDEVLLRALSKDPAARFPDMTAMAAAFRRAAAGFRPTTAKQARSLPAASYEELRYAEKWLDAFVDSVSDPATARAIGGEPRATASFVPEAASIAYTLFRIASAREDARLCALAVRWLDLAARENPEAAFCFDSQVTQETVGCFSPCHSPAGVACLEALVANSTGDAYARTAAAHRFLQLSREVLEKPEVANGSWNTLLALSLLLDAFRPDLASPQKVLVEAGNQLFASLWQQCDAQPGIAESPLDLGIGGWAGHLYATLRWMQSAQMPAPGNLPTRLEQLSQQARWDGACAGWPSQVRPGSAICGGWYNGSAGYVFLWCLAHRLLRDARWLRLAEGAGWDACRPREEGWDLCCGLGGKAYGELHLYKHTGDRVWLYNASALATRALRQAQPGKSTEGVPIPLSVCKGRSGLAILISDLMRPECSAMPFFEDEGWPASLG